MSPTYQPNLVELGAVLVGGDERTTAIALAAITTAGVRAGANLPIADGCPWILTCIAARAPQSLDDRHANPHQLRGAGKKDFVVGAREASYAALVCDPAHVAEAEHVCKPAMLFWLG